MRAAKKLTVDSKLLQELVPLNALSTERFREVSEKIIIEEVLAGQYLFRKGDRDNQSIYMLEGKVNLIDGFRKVTSEVEAGSDISRYPIANQQPRSLSARAVKKVVIAKVDSSLLDVFLTWDQSNTAEVVDIGTETNKDWMTRILQSEAFIKIPPSMIQSLLIKMEPLQVEAGTRVICQGDGGDYFYTVHEGRCAVTRQESPDGEEQLLAELGEGDSFGEDALVSDVKRNASVTMLTDGLLMRLAKRDFVELLKNQLVKRVDYERAVAMVDDGAVWVDVRTADEYENGAFEDSVNIPLFRLRDELSELVYNSKYIICCDTGRRSESAGFLLSHKGFDVYVLQGGIPGLSNNDTTPMVEDNTQDSIEALAEVVDFDNRRHEISGESDTDMSVAVDQYEDSDTSEDGIVPQKTDETVVLLEELRTENKSLAAQLQTYMTSEARMTEQLEQLRGELGESGERLAALYAQAKLDAEQLELLRGELGESGEKPGAFYAKENDAVDENQLLQEQNHLLQEEFSGRASAYEQKIGQLQAELEEGRSLLLATESAAQQQQADRDAELAELQRALDSEQQVVATLREELSQAELQYSEDRSALEAELKAQLDKSHEKNESLEIRQVELKQNLSRQEEDMQAVIAEREQLQQQRTDAEAQIQQLDGELVSLREEAETQAAASNEQQLQLQAQLHESLEKIAAAEQSGDEKDAQLSSLQEQLAQQGADYQAHQQEREIWQQQLDDLHSQLKQQEERAMTLEEESKTSMQKAHEDLTRKNDNEKELQGQIDRLRKKVEQQTTDQQKSREDAREDIDNLRDQLHAERKERATERSEMAARQRELKEQLALIATEHEAKLTNHNGAIEQARDAARQEEQERVRELLAEHVQAEDQVNRLQQELNKAHEEIAELVRQEKDRRKVDVDLMEEQNQQAIATISQLESQLKQYTEERDAALGEQQSLRDSLNALRGEVEVARGLMGVAEQVEDPAKLRNELNESKKNIEIALRLRAEAETARDQLQKERDALRQQLDPGEVLSEPLHVPSLDSISGSGHPGPGHKNQQVVLPVIPMRREQDSELHPLLDGRRDGKQRRWLGAAIGMCVVAACALAGWVLIGADTLLSDDTAAQQLPVAAKSERDPVASVSSETETIDVQEVLPTVEDAVEAVEASSPVPEAVTEQASVQRQAPVAEPILVTQQRPAATRPDKTVDVEQQTAVTAGRSYRDSLQGGNQGPLMIELPAGSYQMGSVGNSLNYDEGPRHPVTLPEFSVSKFEVTFAEYDRFARATGRHLPYDESWGRGDRPVINVSWGDARAYTRWLSKQTGYTYRLPSEAEWEYATRAGTAGNFWWFNDNDNLHANCFNCGSEWDSKRTAPVGSFEANGFGLHDVAGNVQEWTADCYHGSYHGAPVDGSAWQFPECVMRVVRGGAYTSPLDSLRNAKRSQYDQDTRLDNLGFRVVREH